MNNRQGFGSIKSNLVSNPLVAVTHDIDLSTFIVDGASSSVNGKRISRKSDRAENVVARPRSELLYSRRCVPCFAGCCSLSGYARNLIKFGTDIPLIIRIEHLRFGHISPFLRRILAVRIQSKPFPFRPKMIAVLFSISPSLSRLTNRMTLTGNTLHLVAKHPCSSLLILAKLNRQFSIFRSHFCGDRNAAFSKKLSRFLLAKIGVKSRKLFGDLKQNFLKSAKFYFAENPLFMRVCGHKKSEVTNVTSQELYLYL